MADWGRRGSVNINQCLKDGTRTIGFRIEIIQGYRIIDWQSKFRRGIDGMDYTNMIYNCREEDGGPTFRV